MIRSGAAASRQIGARPARDQEQATRSQDIDYSVGFFNFSESEKKFVYQSRQARIGGRADGDTRRRRSI